MTRMTLGVETPIFVNCYGSLCLIEHEEEKGKHILSVIVVVVVRRVVQLIKLDLLFSNQLISLFRYAHTHQE